MFVRPTCVILSWNNLEGKRKIYMSKYCLRFVQIRKLFFVKRGDRVLGEEPELLVTKIRFDVDVTSAHAHHRQWMDTRLAGS